MMQQPTIGLMQQPLTTYTSSVSGLGMMQQPTMVQEGYTTVQAGQAYTTVQQGTTAGYTTTSYKQSPKMSSSISPRRASTSSHLTAQEAISKAHAMHQEVQELETTITAQQDEIAWLKAKLLHHKRKTLEKYFMWDEDFAKQACFHEWKHFMHKQQKLREVDGIHSAREGDRAEMMRKVHELQDQLGQMDNAYQQLAAQEAQTRDKLAGAEQLIRTVAGATTEYDMETPSKSPSRVDGEAPYIKSQLHNLLQEVDPQYIVPLKVLNVNDQTMGSTAIEGAPTQGNNTMGFAGTFRPPSLAAPQQAATIIQQSGANLMGSRMMTLR